MVSEKEIEAAAYALGKAHHRSISNARWRESHKSGEYNPDYCAASEALAEALTALSAANERVAELEQTVMDIGLRLTLKGIDDNIDVYKRLAKR